MAEVQDQAANPSKPAETTFQQDLVTAGQRRINVIWEVTQAAIALVITLGVIFCAVTKSSSEVLTNAFFLIVGFYFSRTNHTKTGGVGANDSGR